MVALIDTNLLVYRFDSRFPDKQRKATELLRLGIANDNVRVPYQALLEFVAAVTRARSDDTPLLDEAEAHRVAEEMLAQFEVLYPNEGVYRTALRGAATYRLPWFDASIWAYADCFGIPELLSEDFQHGRLYGRVRALNPFL